jgi:MFS family permease
MPLKISRRFGIDYGWFIVLAGTLCILGSIGLGRFTIGMILPSMASNLGLSYSEIGFISTANFVGYLIAVLISGMLVGRWGARKVIFLALLLVGISISLLGLSAGFLSAALLYALTGVGSGASNIPMMALVARWFVRQRRGRAAGFMVIGSGFAILLSGKMVPLVNETFGTMGWRVNWWITGGIVLIISFFCLKVLRDSPEEIGENPSGSSGVEADGRVGPYQKRPDVKLLKDRLAYHLGLVYFIFGFTYVIYVTFIVTYLVKERHIPEAVAGNFWAWLGLLSLLSGPVFGTLSDRIGRRGALILVFSFQSLSYFLIATGGTALIIYASVGLFGVVAWSIPSIMAALIGDIYGAERTPEVFGFVTFIFSIGQIGGPAVAGMIADKTGSFSYSFLMASFMAVLAILLTIRIGKGMLHFVQSSP